MKTFNKKSTVAVLVASLVFGVALPVAVLAAQPQVNLQTADNFAVLAGSTITNTGPTVINGNMGLSPNNSITGFPPGIVNGTQYVANTTATTAQTDLTAAYIDASGRTPSTAVPAELGGSTLQQGVYTSDTSSFAINGNLTLDGENDPNAVFIFKAASTLVTGDASTVTLINGASACNIFWQVTSSATLGKTSDFKGNILSLQSITLTTGAKVTGSVLARNGAVTLDTNTIDNETCAGGTGLTTTSPLATPLLPNTGTNSAVTPLLIAAIVTGVVSVAGTLYLVRKNQSL